MIMRSIAMRFFLLSLLAVETAAAAAGAAAPPEAARGRSPLGSHHRISKVFMLEKGQSRLDLGTSFIVEGSDSVFMNGVAMERESDYRINLLMGTLVLVSPASGGEAVRISWQRYPFAFSPVFAARFPDDSGPLRVTRPPAPPIEGEGKKGSPYRLRLSGSKSVGFSLGSDRGLGIDQSLKMTMAGKLAKDLEVRAFLSDDNLPVQPEGNTEELKHLDRVMVEVKSKHTTTSLGDFSTGLHWSKFSSFQRELRGATSVIEAGKQRFFAGGGIAKGRFRTASFFGREGVQGPYELLDARRFNGVIILPGTETVYLDGRELKRGSENDYTIDYNRGTLTFTEKVSITRDSEIAVDYQMGEDEYERTTLDAGWSSSFWGEGLKLKTFFFQEKDNADKPVRGQINKEEADLLENAGDNPELALAPGITEVEDAEDAYILVPAGELPAHYEFVETGGRYLLDFYQVGVGKGDYATDGFTKRGEVKYAYVGEGMGSFSIGRLLPLPERKQVFSVGLEAGRGIFFLDAEGNLSRYDKNLRSKLDDGDNDGGALSFVGGIRGVGLLSGKLSVSGEYSSLDKRFVAPDMVREPYFYRNWNLEGVELTGREEISGLSLDWSRGKDWTIRGSSKHLSREGGISAAKQEISARLGDLRTRGIGVDAFSTDTGAGRDRRFAKAAGALAFWHLIPAASYDTERYRSFSAEGADTGRFYYRGTVSLAGRDTGRFRSLLSYSLRRTDNMREEGGEWIRARENDEISLDGGYTGGSRIVDLLVTRRIERESLSGRESKNDLARVRYRDSWEKAGVTSDLGYRISSGEDRKLEKAVIYVGENEGDYDSEGREVGQRRGDYMVLFLPGGEVETVRSVEFTWRTSIGRGLRGIVAGDEGGGLTGTIRRNVSVDHFFSVLERSATDDLWALYTLDPAVLQRDDVTLFGSNSLRQEWSFLNDVKKYNLRLIYSREDEEDNRSEGVSLSRFGREVTVKAEAVVGGKFTLSLDAGTKLRERESTRSLDQRYRVESYSLAQTADYRQGASTTLSLELGLERRRDAVSLADQVSYMATPSFKGSVGGKVRLTSFFRFTYTDVRAESGKPLFFLEEGMREDWSLTGQYRFTKNVSFGLNYNGRREKNYAGEVNTVHALKMESRAYF